MSASNRPPREEIIVLVGLVVMVFAVCGLIGGVLAISRVRAAPEVNQAEATAPPTPQDFEVPTAREAYVPALELVRELDATASLASGAGAWTAGATREQAASGRTGWTFHFFIPASQEMATIVVNRGKEARLITQEEWPTAPNLLQDQFWQVDSPTVAERLLEVCADSLSRQTTLEIRLSTAATNGRLLWVGEVQSNGEILCEIRVDATTGQVR